MRLKKETAGKLLNVTTEVAGDIRGRHTYSNTSHLLVVTWSHVTLVLFVCRLWLLVIAFMPQKVVLICEDYVAEQNVSVS